MNAARTTEAATTFASTGQLGLSASATRDMYYREGSAMVRREFGRGGVEKGRGRIGGEG